MYLKGPEESYDAEHDNSPSEALSDMVMTLAKLSVSAVESSRRMIAFDMAKSYKFVCRHNLTNFRPK